MFVNYLMKKPSFYNKQHISLMAFSKMLKILLCFYNTYWYKLYIDIILFKFILQKIYKLTKFNIFVTKSFHFYQIVH